MLKLDEEEKQELSVLMARQPIFTKNKDVVAFELLFRDDEGKFVEGLKDDEATLNVLLNTYASIPGEGEEKKAPFLIKVTDKFLLSHDIPEIPRDSFVIEIIGATEISDALINKVKQLASDGYRIALADYDPNEQKFAPLLSLVHIVKLDVQLLGLMNIPAIVRQLRPYGLDLLADKIETNDEFRECVEMGFELFMGYFLSRPELVKGRKVTGNKLVLLQILQELQNPHATAKSVEEYALRDPELTYKILRVVNSAAFSLRREVSSLSHAISLLGLNQIKRWVMLFLSVSEGDKPMELTRQMLQRGRMCEVMAEMMEKEEPMNYFFVGLLSQLDVLLGIPLEELLEQVPLEDHLKKSLVDKSGNEGAILQDVEYYEKGDFPHLKLPLDKQFFEVAYRHSISWSNQVLSAMKE